jgi:hypothetical protein
MVSLVVPLAHLHLTDFQTAEVPLWVADLQLSSCIRHAELQGAPSIRRSGPDRTQGWLSVPCSLSKLAQQPSFYSFTLPILLAEGWQMLHVEVFDTDVFRVSGSLTPWTPQLYSPRCAASRPQAQDPLDFGTRTLLCGLP